MIAKFYGNNIVKKNGYVNRNIKLITKNNFIYKKYINVKCFHEYSIVNKNNKLEEFAVTKDNFVEFFKIKNKKVYGIMWHPERDKTFKNFNIRILKKICS